MNDNYYSHTKVEVQVIHIVTAIIIYYIVAVLLNESESRRICHPKLNTWRVCFTSIKPEK